MFAASVVVSAMALCLQAPRVAIHSGLPRMEQSVPASLQPSALTRRASTVAMGLKGPPPIPSKQFASLGSPANLTAVLDAAAENEVTVVKYQAQWCRTCRAMAPKFDREAKRHGDPSFYSLTLSRNGKAAGERMHRFFVARGANTLPFVEARCRPEQPSSSSVHRVVTVESPVATPNNPAIVHRRGDPALRWTPVHRVVTAESPRPPPAPQVY